MVAGQVRNRSAMAPCMVGVDKSSTGRTRTFQVKPRGFSSTDNGTGRLAGAAGMTTAPPGPTASISTSMTVFGPPLTCPKLLSELCTSRKSPRRTPSRSRPAAISDRSTVVPTRSPQRTG